MDYFIFLSSATLFAVSVCPTPGPNNAIAMSIGISRWVWAALPYCMGASLAGNAQRLVVGAGLGEALIF